MPELPEVETTKRGISPHIQGQIITQVVVRETRMRWPIPSDIHQQLRHKTVTGVSRRGKYLMLHTDDITVLIHLGMSGRLRFINKNTPVQKHDHVDIEFGDHCLRLTDPRRFGAVLLATDPPQHALLKSLGPEPLSDAFNADYLWHRAQKRNVAIKTFIMNSKIVVGVGNIYACEALFKAGIHPERAAGSIALQDMNKLVDAIRIVLQAAILQGGTTLKDFQQSDGKPGYFQQELQVYGRDGQPCTRCDRSLTLKRLANRATVFCEHCQQ